MKIQSVSASLPLLDWRVLPAGAGRIPAIEPQRLGRVPFLKGFGAAGNRSTVRIPWRPSETVFFEAKRGVKLRPFVPGQNTAVRVLRRAYVAGPQVRFDLALFAPMSPTRLRATRYRRAVRDWWSTPIKIRQGDLWKEVSLKDSASHLAVRFRDETQLRQANHDGEANNLAVLPAKLILIGFLPKVDIPPQATAIIDEPPIWMLSSSQLIRDQPKPETTFIFIDESAGKELDVEGFSIVRRIRRELIWLHCDLQFILECARVARREAGNRSLIEALTDSAQKVAEGLSQLDRNEAWGFEPLFFSAWADGQANQIELWRSQIGKGLSEKIPVPSWLSQSVLHSPPERRRKYFQTVQDRLNQTTNRYPKDAALQLGKLALVHDSLLADSESPRHYDRERMSAFETYFGLPASERKSISIVLPVKGDVFPLADCLQSLARQSLVHECPEDVEVIIIEDGPDNPATPLLGEPEIISVLESSNLNSTRRFVLRSHRGRAVARNLGIFMASGEYLMFVDSSMLLDKHHLVEHTIRHHRLPNVALLGFKENLLLENYSQECLDKAVASLNRPPNPRKDWKWRHTVVEDELDDKGVFRFRGRVFQAGASVNYMKLTDFLSDLPASEPIGPRTLPTFFQTNIVSVQAWPVRQVGGFHSKAFRDNLWGLEDSHLGALLVASGISLVPCPSATAFKIEHAEAAAKREFDLIRHRQLYQELVRERMWQRAHEAEEEIKLLKKSSAFVELTNLD